MGNNSTREPPPQRTVQDIQNDIQVGRQKKFNEIMAMISDYVVKKGRNYGYLNYPMTRKQDAKFAITLLREAGFQVGQLKESDNYYGMHKMDDQFIGIEMDFIDFASCFLYVDFILEIENPQPLELPPAYNQAVKQKQ